MINSVVMQNLRELGQMIWMNIWMIYLIVVLKRNGFVIKISPMKTIVKMKLNSRISS